MHCTFPSNGEFDRFLVENNKEKIESWSPKLLRKRRTFQQDAVEGYVGRCWSFVFHHHHPRASVDGVALWRVGYHCWKMNCDACALLGTFVLEAYLLKQAMVRVWRAITWSWGIGGWFVVPRAVSEIFSSTNTRLKVGLLLGFKKLRNPTILEMHKLDEVNLK